jgi:hypothetical protein
MSPFTGAQARQQPRRLHLAGPVTSLPRANGPSEGSVSSRATGGSGSGSQRLRVGSGPIRRLGGPEWTASTAAPAATSERRDRTAQGYRRFRCRDCGRQFNERSGGLLNRAQYPSDIIALVVLWRLRYRLTLQGLSEMFLERGIVFSHDTKSG